MEHTLVEHTIVARTATTRAASWPSTSGSTRPPARGSASTRLLALAGAAACLLVAPAASAQNGHAQIYPFFGEASFAAGTSVSSAGDFDLDGVDDYIVGAPGAPLLIDKVLLPGVGRVAVVSGRTGSALFDQIGATEGGAFGQSVASAGDVNSDGFADIIVGAPFDGSGGTASVFAGPDGTLLYSFFGDSFGDQFGGSVAAAGDVNNDGFGDLIVGAVSDDDNGQNAGSARVLSGATGGLLYTFVGDSAFDRFGTSVSSAGDVDGDGFDDLLIGTPGDDNNGSNSGSVSLFSGATGSIIARIDGFAAGELFGFSVARLGDVDGDGTGDFVVGAYGSDIGGTDSGAAYVFSGATRALLRTIAGNAPSNAFGFSVASAGDINNDTIDDIIVGAPDVDTAGLDAGSASVFSGATGAVLAVVNGAAAGGALGWSVSGAGDLNGDGIGDFMAGAPFDDRQGDDAGSVDVYISARLAMAPAPAPCLGDADGSGTVTFDDITTVLGNFGITCP